MPYPSSQMIARSYKFDLEVAPFGLQELAEQVKASLPNRDATHLLHQLRELETSVVQPLLNAPSNKQLETRFLDGLIQFSGAYISVAATLWKVHKHKVQALLAHAPDGIREWLLSKGEARLGAQAVDLALRGVHAVRLVSRAAVQRSYREEQGLSRPEVSIGEGLAVATYAFAHTLAISVVVSFLRAKRIDRLTTKNAQTLARWSYDAALDAYRQAKAAGLLAVSEPEGSVPDAEEIDPVIEAASLADLAAEA